jgi:hypothetical protein
MSDEMVEPSVKAAEEAKPDEVEIESHTKK